MTLQAKRDGGATLVDLLERILDKGVLLDADLLIHVAGIPLLGVKLKAAVAGMETMLKYGLWTDWDEVQRAICSGKEVQLSDPGAASSKQLETGTSSGGDVL